MPGSVRRGRRFLRGGVGRAKQKSQQHRASYTFASLNGVRVTNSTALSILVGILAEGMKLTADAGPMPAPFPIEGQAHHVQHHATKTVLSEHKCHRAPFA